jgi:hypothetical protein
VLKTSVAAIAAAFLIATAPPGSAQTVGDAGSNRIFQKLQGNAVPSGLGINIHFDGRTADLDIAKAMGFRIVRTDVTWSEVETQPGVYNWEPYDLLVARSRELGLIPFLILAYSNPIYAPEWKGAASGRLDWAFAPPVTETARGAFAAFAARAAQRYGNTVIWEVWNEPDLTFGKPFQRDAYLRLADDACAAMRRASPDSTIVGPAVSGFDWGLLEEFVRRDTGGCFDAVSVHPYRDWDPDSAFADWQRLKSILDKGNPRGPKIAIDSEWGYSVQSGPWTEYRQAAYVTRLYLTDLLADVPITIVYDLRNDGTDSSDKEQNFGLLDARGEPKRVAAALTELIRNLDGLTLAGRIRTPDPAVTAIAFGRAGRPLIAVAWSSRPTPRSIRLGPTICIAPSRDTKTSCAPTDIVLQTGAMSLDLEEMPKFFALRCDASRTTGPPVVTTPCAP